MANTFVHSTNAGHHAFGTRTAASAADFTIDLGFEPKYIKVLNITDRISGEWLGGTNQLKSVAAGTRTAEDCGITVDGTSFTVDISVATLQTDNDETYWEARG